MGQENTNKTLTMTPKVLSREKKPNDKTCYLQFVDGYLRCTINHRTGTPCLMDNKELY